MGCLYGLSGFLKKSCLSPNFKKNLGLVDFWKKSCLSPNFWQKKLLKPGFFDQNCPKKSCISPNVSYSRILGKVAYSRSFYIGFNKERAWAFEFVHYSQISLKPDSYYIQSCLYFQLWRLVTNFLFFGTIGFNFLFNMIFTYRYCRMLEEGSFRGRAAGKT